MRCCNCRKKTFAFRFLVTAFSCMDGTLRLDFLILQFSDENPYCILPPSCSICCENLHFKLRAATHPVSEEEAGVPAKQLWCGGTRMLKQYISWLCNKLCRVIDPPGLPLLTVGWIHSAILTFTILAATIWQSLSYSNVTKKYNLINKQLIKQIICKKIKQMDTFYYPVIPLTEVDQTKPLKCMISSVTT